MHPNFNPISKVYSISSYMSSRTVIECFSLSETQSRFIFFPPSHPMSPASCSIHQDVRIILNIPTPVGQKQVRLQFNTVLITCIFNVK